MENRFVLFDLPFPLRLGDLQEFGEITVNGSPVCGVGLSRKSNERPGIQSLGIVEGGDPYGRSTYTQVQLRFYLPTSPEVAAWGDNEPIRTAIDRINHLIETLSGRVR
jgi:hypothetical protein